MSEKEVYTFAYIGIFSTIGTDPEECRRDLEDWMLHCTVGALDGMNSVNLHVADAMVYGKDLNKENRMCCRMKDQETIEDECVVEYVECEEFNNIYSSFPLVEGEEGTPCRYMEKENGQKVILTEKISGYLSLDKVLLSAIYFDILSFARKKEIHNISFPVAEMMIQGKTVGYSAYTAFHTVSTWYWDNSDYGMKVTFVCPDEETKVAYEQCVKY